MDIDRALCDTHRDINVQDGWWDYAYETFLAELDGIGISACDEDICFSGFYCQGDGASFEGRVRDWRKLLTAMGYGDKAALIEYFEMADTHCRIYRRGHLYVHQFTMCLELDNFPEFPSDEYFSMSGFNLLAEGCGLSEFKRGVMYELLRPYSSDALEQELLEFVRGKAGELYVSLREEYEYLTSDEQVWESIVANDLHLTGDTDDEQTM